MESNATHIHSAERRGGSSPAAAPMPTMRPRRHGMDYLLFLTVAAICAFGVVMLFSASYYYAQSFQGDGYYYVKKQLLFLAIGIPVMFGLSFVDYKFYRRFAWMAYLLIILLLIAVLLFGKKPAGRTALAQNRSAAISAFRTCKVHNRYLHGKIHDGSS